MAHGNDPGAWKENFELDVLGAVNAFDAAMPFLRKSAEQKGDAAFVIISSVSAVVADYADSYGPIKAALIHLAKGLARQHAKAGIRTNVVSPGMVYFEGGVWHGASLKTLMLSKRRSPAIRQVGVRHRRKLLMLRYFSQVPSLPTQQGQISLSTVRLQIA